MPTPTLEAPGDVLRRMLDDTIRVWDPVWQSWSAAMPTWPAPEPADTRRDCGCAKGHAHEHPEGHHACARGACDCCIGEADLVVVTRLGESRIVPLVIHNEWRRERTVEVEVGDFSPSCHEDGLVRVAATTRPGGAITIAACGRVEVGILLRTAPPAGVEVAEVLATAAPRRGAAAKATAKVAAEAGAAPVRELIDKEPLEKQALEREGTLPDVGCCTTMYADVRVSGCGRPLRLAVVVLPLHCDAYEVDCHCGCC